MANLESPESVVARYFECLRNGSYDGAASLVAPICLRRFVENEAPRYRPHPPPTVDQYLERDPDMPREVAEYRVGQAARLSRTSLSDYFAGIETEAELESLSDRELYASHIEAADPAARCRRQIDQLRSRHTEYESELLDVRNRQASTWNFVILGAVTVDDRVLVLFEHELPAPPDELRWEPKPHVAVLRETSEGWRLAGDPNPYAGMGVALAPIEVTNAEGEKVVLDVSGPG